MNITVPELDIDKTFANMGRPVSLNGRVERRIVAGLIQHLSDRGFNVAAVDDGEERTLVSTAKEAMEIIFNLDEAWLQVRATAGVRSHTIFLVLGNGEDIISDYNYTEGDPDQFAAAMEAFKPEEMI